MRVETVAKKISCTVVKTSLMRGNEDMLFSTSLAANIRFQPAIPIVEIDLSKHIRDISEKAGELNSQSRFLDYYA